MRRIVAIGLKIPDNTAFTALTALRRLGLPVDRVDHSEIWELDDAGEAATLEQRVAANAAIFNPNKHLLDVRQRQGPQAGEAWISEAGDHDEIRERLGGTPIRDVTQAVRSVSWRMCDACGNPVDRAILVRAVEGLLCNPAIEKARYE